MKIILNGVLQPASSELIVTSTGIDGKFSSPLIVGLNNLEISFVDGQGNQRKKSQYFYFEKKNGGSEYIADSSTSGLWHFNDIVGGQAKDSSGNNNHFESPQLVFEPGVIGLAGKGVIAFTNKMPLNCRAFTIEGQFKANDQIPSFRQLYSLANSSYTQIVRMNPFNGNIQLYFNSQATTLDTEIPQAVPVDNAFHHIAIVYDGNRAYSQLLVVVDGVVKRAVDYHNSCDFTGTNTFSVGEGVAFSVDELRVSKTAQYSFNLQKEISDRPVLVSTSVPASSTVTETDFTFSFSVSDSDGISAQHTVLSVNGVEQQITTQSKLKPEVETSFSSDVELMNGANLFSIKMQDMKGNDQVKTFFIYHFTQGVSGEYQSDENTLFLFHMNETSGSFFDSSPRGLSFSTGGWVTNQTGVFNKAASIGSGGINLSLGDMSTSSGYTIESWKKGYLPGADYYLFYSATFSLGFAPTGGIRAYINGNIFTQTQGIVNDTNFHHYAIVVDKNHPTQNVYLLADGKVVYSTKTSANLNQGVIGGAGLGYYTLSTTIDEARFSNVARYEFVSSPN